VCVVKVPAPAEIDDCFGNPIRNQGHKRQFTVANISNTSQCLRGSCLGSSSTGTVVARDSRSHRSALNPANAARGDREALARHYYRQR